MQHRGRYGISTKNGIDSTLIFRDKVFAENNGEKQPIDNYLEILNKKEIANEISEIFKYVKKLIPKAQSIGSINKLLSLKRSTDYDYNQITEILKKVVKLTRAIKGQLKKDETYRTLMQDFGDNIRSTGNPFDYRLLKNTDEILRNEVHLTLAKDVERLINFLSQKRGHSFFIIDSFRNPYEALYFRDKYIDFYLISLFSNFKVRKERLLNKFDEEGEKRDQGKYIKNAEEHFYMQNVPKTVKFADIAINNNDDLPKKNGKLIKDKIIEKIIRYLALIFDAGCTKPTDDEVMMNLAYAMAMKSNCISNQIGAVIEGKDGYIVGAGWNDVGEGKISCGLREIKDLEIEWYERYVEILNGNLKDVKSYLIEEYKNGQPLKIEEKEFNKFCFCFKDAYSKRKFSEKIKKLAEKCQLPEKYKQIITKELEEKRLKYCEALHAEENAIIQSSKIGGMGLIGGKIYTTAFPCELCAKKIQQVGISEIIYTEPYPGNISEPIYLQDTFQKIKVRQFEGVMPHKYFKLFKVVDDQKDWQKMYSRGLVK